MPIDPYTLIALLISAARDIYLRSTMSGELSEDQKAKLRADADMIFSMFENADPPPRA